ncbi:unnamed protein product [Rotaria magnacalcarata]|uniref:Uncharacterized protein n=2 Tax=Rotaria magnacalcarata TaxID=392030 RepID=A0A816TXX0_9BILA|nr:unnamed protein product [Rotaria magnacalcarata]CAF1599158.1 unnamed protein product [Rotaria magnacalcarata]CAF2093957.1 unnamed protein product [Rotaria magnacalcarata]CAF2102305.1 unnamed protein product [Rotaria magnacalcarata]CAF2242612.1 unnamed protein product [Rotaria magnacalcarata]
MVLAPCVISFALGLVCIDMFCDHYSLLSSSLNSFQLNTCVSYYENAFHQPWYTSLVTLIPMLIGAVIMLRNMMRSIYDMLSVPLFIAVVGIFLLRIQKYIQLLASDAQATNTAKEGYLKHIAYDHSIIGALLILLLILQILAGKIVKVSTKKNL